MTDKARRERIALFAQLLLPVPLGMLVAWGVDKHMEGHLASDYTLGYFGVFLGVCGAVVGAIRFGLSHAAAEEKRRAQDERAAAEAARRAAKAKPRKR